VGSGAKERDVNVLGFDGNPVSLRPEPGAVGALDDGEWWQEPACARVLIVAASGEWATPALLEAVRRRAASGPAEFHVVLPDPAQHAELTDRQRRRSRRRGMAVLHDALRLLTEAAGTTVNGSVSGRHDPMDAVEETLQTEHVDEIILATVHHRVSERLHVDLPRRMAHLGLPVTTVMTDEPDDA
jgi:hypothetical protein